MLIAYLMLGGFVAFIVVCLLIAARRGLWLMVEIDQRVHTQHTVVHHHEVAHHHHVHQPGRAEPLPVAHVTGSRPLPRTVLSRAVLPRRTPQHLPAHTTKESQ